MKIEVHPQGGTRRVIEIEAGATKGATVGVNVWNQDGSLFVPAAATPETGGPPITYWRLIQEIPPNVVALAETATTGLYVITGAGTSETRSIQAAPGETTVSNGDGVAGNPTIGLADVTPTPGGTLQRYGFDAKGRRSEEDSATTDDLPEGGTNLYFTDERAQDAAGGVLDNSGDVELHYEMSPVRRIWATLSAGISSLIGSKADFTAPNGEVAIQSAAGARLLAGGAGYTFGVRPGADTATVPGVGAFTIQSYAGANLAVFPEDPGATVPFQWPALSLAGNAVWNAGNMPLDSGTYTPATTGALNVASTSGGLCTYQRIGSTVEVSGTVLVTPSAASANTLVLVPPPIPSDFATNTDVGGAGVASIGSTRTIVDVRCAAGDDQLVVGFTAISASEHTVRFNCAYPIM